MEVTDLGMEESAADQTEGRVAEVAMEKRHRARRNAASKAVSHDKVAAIAQSRYELIEAREIVTVVGVPHDDVGPARRRNASLQGRAVATLGHGNDPCAGGERKLDGAIGGTIIGDQHFTDDVRAFEKRASFVDAAADRLRFVEAWHQDCQYDAAAVICRNAVSRQFQCKVHCTSSICHGNCGVTAYE